MVPHKYTAACVLFSALLALTGCTVHTVDDKPLPLVEGADRFSGGVAAEETDRESWWESFDDSRLDAMIRSGLANNYDIMQAVARLGQAQSLLIQADAARLPEVGLAADTDQQWWEDGGRLERTRVGALFTWEIDAFNRLQAIGVARERQVQARINDIEAVRLGLSAAVAEAWFDAIGWRSQLRLLQEQIEADRDLLELIELRYDSGISALVDVLQQASQLADVESLVPPVQAALRVSENRLDVLLGQPPDSVDRVPADATLVEIDALPFVGVPADLLQNRPDLRALQNELIAADAEIGRAIADRFPNLFLDGSLLYEDGPVINGVSTSLIGSVFQPLLDWGARKAEVERNRSLYVEQLANYTQAYLQAIEDVENTLYQERKQREFLERLDRRLLLLERTFEETSQRYAAGLTDFLPVLDALKELQQLQRVIVQQQRELIDFRIQLYRAVGGAVPPPETTQNAEMHL